ncbi:aminoglycoside phosphotransferase family protein [Streptosporangiaceae bacterium NEAU-GS5]|nr:aminoglycoside phosphotransferase family protein [Streptosporangiaceae bacterium NEAU-GS5]
MGAISVTDLVQVSGSEGPVHVLKDTRVLVVRVGAVVVKAYPDDADEDELTARLELCRVLGDLLLPPLGLVRVGGRPVTIWPAGDPVTPEDLSGPGGVPWEEAARLLAALHSRPAPSGAPLSGGPARLARAMARLGADSPPEIAAAYASLPEPAQTRQAQTRQAHTQQTLTHGDWHLGQIVRHDGRWWLIDPDDLGIGDPAWDLARPAAWFASGLLEPAAWQRFLGAYVQAAGPAVSRDDPWRELDAPARALTVQLAATAVATARHEGRPLDAAGEALVSSCRRIAAADAP